MRLLRGISSRSPSLVQQDVRSIVEAAFYHESTVLSSDVTIPWYIIDPTGYLIAAQRRRIASAKAIESSASRKRQELRRTPNGKSSRLFPRRHVRILQTIKVAVYTRMTVFPAWDIVASIALLFTVAVTPFEVGFLPPPESALEPLFLLNRVVDGIFLTDILLHFFIMIPAKGSASARGLSGEWEFRLSVIAAHYLRGWFVIDVLSVAPSVFDILPLLESDGDSSYSRGTAALRAIRALRLVKLIRVVRASRLFTHLREQVSLPNSTIKLFSLAFRFLLLLHSFACVVGIMTTFAESPLQTWMATHGYCRPTGEGIDAQTGLLRYECVRPSSRYLNCLWWAFIMVVTQTTHPEYGPYDAYVPTNSSGAEEAETDTYGGFTLGEQVVVLVLLILGTFLFSLLFGELLVSMTHDDPERIRHTNEIDNLNRFCKRHGLDVNLRRELRRYFFETVELRATERSTDALRKLSPMLVDKVTWHIHERWLDEVPCFKFGSDYKRWGRRIAPEERRAFLIDLVKSMELAVFAPKEVPPSHRLYFLTQGSVVYARRGLARTLGPGSHWGEYDVMLTSSEQKGKATTTTYAHVQYIARAAMLTLKERYPAPFRAVLAWVIYHAMCAQVVTQLRDKKAAVQRKAIRQPSTRRVAFSPETRRIERQPSHLGKHLGATAKLPPIAPLAIELAPLEELVKLKKLIDGAVERRFVTAEGMLQVRERELSELQQAFQSAFEQHSSAIFSAVGPIKPPTGMSCPDGPACRGSIGGSGGSFLSSPDGLLVAPPMLETCGPAVPPADLPRPNLPAEKKEEGWGFGSWRFGGESAEASKKSAKKAIRASWHSGEVVTSTSTTAPSTEWKEPESLNDRLLYV